MMSTTTIKITRCKPNDSIIRLVVYRSSWAARRQTLRAKGQLHNGRTVVNLSVEINVLNELITEPGPFYVMDRSCSDFDAVKTRIWIAVSVYVLIAIVQKRLSVPATLRQSSNPVEFIHLTLGHYCPKTMNNADYSISPYNNLLQNFSDHFGLP